MPEFRTTSESSPCAEGPAPTPNAAAPPDQPVLICGLGQVGIRVLEYLRLAELPVVAIDDRAVSLPDEPLYRGVRLVRGDFKQREVLLDAGLERARAVLILTNNDLVNISATLMIRHLHPSVRVVVRLFNQNLLLRLGKAVCNTVALNVAELTAPLLTLVALEGQALGTFGHEPHRHEIAELVVGDRSPLVDRSIAQIASRYGVAILASNCGTPPEQRFLLQVDEATRLRMGDRLIVTGEYQKITPLLSQVAEESPGLAWAGWLRRMGRVIWRALSEMDLAVKICASILCTVLVTSTLIYHYWIGRPSWSESLYRTVSVIATGADMHADRLEAAHQVYVSILRLTGAALMGCFIAILNTYLLRARLSGALEARRIPDRGHIIVCGLGNIGFRVVEEMLRYGHRVVVIEKQRDSRFLSVVRRQGVAVLVGDATVLEVLQHAHAATCRALIAATSNELVNLEIALLARDLNALTRVVVRLFDLKLAETLRETANIRFALSVPHLAAPAFVAAVFGDRVQSVFLIRGKLFAALDLSVGEDDSFLAGQPVRALAHDYRFVPVCLMGADGLSRRKPLYHRLAAGDRLTVITAFSDLERLLRRERVAADCAVHVTGFTLPARNFLVQYLSARRGCAPAEAEMLLTQLPLEIASALTRGQAEDLAACLEQEGVKACCSSGANGASPRDCPSSAPDPR